jgi:hypothetical protein
MEPVEQCWRCKRMTPTWAIDGCCPACADEIAADHRRERAAEVRRIQRQVDGGNGRLIVLVALGLLILIGLAAVCR